MGDDTMMHPTQVAAVAMTTQDIQDPSRTGTNFPGFSAASIDYDWEALSQSQ